MKPSEYIEETSKAVQQIFDGLSFYRRILEEDPRPVHVFDANPDDETAWKESLERWYKEMGPEIAKSLEKQREYSGYSFSQATLAGAILQIASMGISLFSKNSEVPESCRDFVSPKSKHVKFCIGRIVSRLPIGVIVLAARNQYNHWDDPKPHDLTVAVFDRIANASGKYTDPTFDLKNRSPNTYSHNVVSLLKWTDYDAYLADAKALFGTDAGAA